MNAYWLYGGGQVSEESLRTLGVQYEYLDPQGAEPAILERMATKGYVTRDVMSLPLPTKSPAFDAEHSHKDEEVRYITSGGGAFDVRSEEDHWIRIEVGPGDLLTIPAGMHHRFVLAVGSNTQITCTRLFKSESGWVATLRT